MATDDYAYGPSTTGRLKVGKSATGTIDDQYDSDSFAVELKAGREYIFYHNYAYGNLAYGDLALHDDSWTELASGGTASPISYSPAVDGTYYLSVSVKYISDQWWSGPYALSVREAGDDYAEGHGSAGVTEVGFGDSGTIETAGDRDTFFVSALPGDYVFEVRGAAGSQGTLASPTVELLGGGADGGTVVAADPNPAGNGTATIRYQLDRGINYYLTVGGLGNSVGGYEMSMRAPSTASSNLRFVDARIEERLDADGDGYARQLKIAFDVDSDAPSQYYVKVYEEDLLSRDDPLITTERFDVAGPVKDYQSVEIGVDEHLRLPGFDTFSRGAAEFRLDLFDAATDTLVKTWRTADDPDLGNVLVEPSDEDYDETRVSQSGNDLIDGLLTGYKWGVGPEHTGATITYSFPADNANWPGEYELSGEPSTGYQSLVQSNATTLLKSSIVVALREWSGVSNVAWVPVKDGAAYGEVRFAGSEADADNLAWTKELRFGRFASDGDVWFHSAKWKDFWDDPAKLAPATFDSGSIWNWTVLHEVGHALGLDHPWDQGLLDGTFVPAEREWIGWTVMSYKVLQGVWREGSAPKDDAEAQSASLTPSVYPSTPMWLDIQAIRYLYGAKDANTGDNSGGAAYVFEEGKSYFQTIVDDGGVDEIRYDSQNDGAKIDLRPGQWNELGNPITYKHNDVTRQTRDGNVILYQDANAENPFDSLIENATGGEGPDDLTGNAAANVLRGNGGNDTLRGGLGDDTLDGGNGFDTVTYAGARAGIYVDLGIAAKQEIGESEGSDTLISIETVIGSAFDDTLSGSMGDDVLDGGAGTDTASYVSAPAAVTVSLGIATPQATGGAGSDTLINIENLVGSRFNDILIGDGGANVLEGRAGNDILRGGAGIDTATYASASGPVTVDVGVTGMQNTGGAGSDTLRNIENLVGSSFNDTLIGDGGANVLEGGLGDDTLRGGAGNDTASYASAISSVKVNLGVTQAQDTGGAGSDTLRNIENLIGGKFGDELIGDDGPNLLVGGAGADSLRGKAGKDSFRFEKPSDGKDIVRDFGGTERDQITIFSPNFGPVASLSNGTLPLPNFIAAKGANLDQRQLEKPNAYFLFNTTNDTLYFDSDGAGTSATRVALAEIKFVTTGDKLSNTDIVLTTSLT